MDWQKISHQIKEKALSLGFCAVGITDTDLSEDIPRFEAWLEKNYHGDLTFLTENKEKRYDPSLLHSSTLRVVSVAMNYLPPNAQFAKTLNNRGAGYISRYAGGRDYHKLMRKRLKKLGDYIREECTDVDFRPFVDSAPVMERPLAKKAGIGWTGKHSLILNKEQGSYFFLGELLVNLPLICDEPHQGDCGKCQACLQICPTGAIVEPYVVDARKCISYLTIENKKAIPVEYRTLLGNRIYGCDDCQLICPWNRYAQITDEEDFYIKRHFREKSLLDLWDYDEVYFLKITEGSAIRRIGYERWTRNLAVALGNDNGKAENIIALKNKLHKVSNLVDEHIIWAINEQKKKLDIIDVVSRKHQRLINVIKKSMPDSA